MANRQKEKVKMKELDPSYRARCFEEVACGYTEEEAQDEIQFWKDGGKLIPLEKHLMPEKPEY